MASDIPPDHNGDHDVPTLHLSKAEREAFLAEVAATQAERLKCPRCGKVNHPERLVCEGCGMQLADEETTASLGQVENDPGPAVWPDGDVIVTDKEPVIFEVEGVQFALPEGQEITVGRHRLPSDSPCPHVDLSSFHAYEKGVSRQHVLVQRKKLLVYVTDMNSTNGTLLNGRRLQPDSERLLRNGDELQLGRFKVKVHLQN